MSVSTKKRRTFILGLDGFPYTFLKEQFQKGLFRHLRGLINKDNLKRMDSVYPTVSSVAWTSYYTGLNPAGHNIFGFIDRTSNPFSLKIPTARDRKGKTLWRELSEQGKKVIVINVPLTYPPEEVNGILISGFLCPDIEKSSYPPRISAYLKSKGYCIDTDAWLAKESKRKFMEQLHQAVEKRFEVAMELLEVEDWDFFQLHIMETDRLFHFFWKEIEEGIGNSREILAFFEKLDDYIERLKEKLSQKDRILVLSDHGFCGIASEFQLNTWLEKEGLLKFESPRDKKLINYQRDTVCYSLIPGRVFINLKGREEKGSVEEKDYEKIRYDIKNRLLDLKDGDGKKVIDRVFFRGEIYSGPYLENSADIIVHPVRGYDLKGEAGSLDLFTSSERSGMHTYDDAFICGVNMDIDSIRSIQDVRKVVLDSENCKGKI